MMDATVPSIDFFGEYGHLMCPYLEPTILAAESPIPTESTPLSKTNLFSDFKLVHSHNGRNTPTRRYIFVSIRLPWSFSSVNLEKASSKNFDIGLTSYTRMYSIKTNKPSTTRDAKHENFHI